jgi:glycopeptide antibiotics resistance protein
MNIWVESIKNGFEIYLHAAPVIFFIAFAIHIRKKSVNPIRFIGVQCLIVYVICLIEVVLFPLPDQKTIASMDGYSGQFVPLKFIYDILTERSLTSILQVMLNVLMTVPFGFFLKFFLDVKRKNIIFMTFILSFVIEIAQLTGLFFIYPGSYRLFDVDDLMLNTLGGFIGIILSNGIKNLIPDLSTVRKIPVSF